ncbi:ArnT family glycosyltransferase [Kineothrix sp. MB12-C1]|uniref:ArnT family glycosyltransferase n=1 Tax=Kineothrix sp. MB12-C1 TaxID=3070215 RepID=UPI0027D2997E|nr:glycosyltransferase family 39 protein [Kineothrix sp. MB12-C1]WMC92464.1 glycosyltransferase family 39 protein [Kineothrix sp. MB12-C1]
MKMKKTWFSYLLWLSYMVITGVLLATCAITISMCTWEMGIYGAIVAVCITFACVAGVWLAGERVIPYVQNRFPKDKHFADMWECFLGMCIFAAAILYRIYYLRHLDGIAGAENEFYHLAQVTGESIPGMAHGASYVYTALLSTVFSFFGNKVMVGIVLQFFLQMGAMLFLYFSLRLLAGRVTALLTAIFMAVSPVFITGISSLTPQVMYLLLYAVGLWLVSLYLKGLTAGYRKGSSYLAFLLLGLYAGVISYLDVLGLTLLFFAALGFVVIDTKAVKNKKIPVGIQFVVIIAAALLGAIALCSAASAYAGQSFVDMLSLWTRQWGESADIRYLLPSPDARPIISLIIYFFAALNAVSFLMRRRQRTDAWVLLLLFLSTICVIGIERMDYGIYITFLWGTLASLGIASIGTGKDMAEATVTVTAIEKGPSKQAIKEEVVIEEPIMGESIIEESISDMEGTGIEDLGIEEIKVEEAPAIEGTKIEEIKLEEVPVIAEIKIEGTIIEEINKPAEPGHEEVSLELKEEKKEIKYIENPLPLPKKHVRKEMDYGIDVPEAEMNYDITSGEQDDFDLK